MINMVGREGKINLHTMNRQHKASDSHTRYIKVLLLYLVHI